MPDVARPRLVLLNGPPASGKSTLARRWVAERPLALDLDIDTVRGLLGAWSDQPHEAGLAARRLALAMATVHLSDGHDVMVPQFLARHEFIDELGVAATRVGARFVEVALLVDLDDALRSFAERSENPDTQEHRDAALLAERSGGAAGLAEAHSAYLALVAARPATRRISAPRGEIELTFARLEAALADAG